MRVARKLLSLILVFSSMAVALLFAFSLKTKQRRLQFHMQMICRILKLRIHFEGSYSGSSPRLIIANHVSYLDAFLIGSLFPTSFLAKAELASWPLLGRLGKLAATVFVLRDSVTSRFKALNAIKSHFFHSEANYCIFPEGTTTAKETPDRNNWHRGHAALTPFTDHEIYCLGLYYQDQGEIAWIDEQTLLPHLLRILNRSHVDVFVTGKVVRTRQTQSFGEAAELSYDTVHALARNAFSLSQERSFIPEEDRTHIEFHQHAEVRLRKFHS